MDLVGYIRVSTATQVEEGQGLEVQLRAIEEWCSRNGHELVAVHRDEGISGAKDTADRPGLASALAAVEDGASGLVMYKLDRLARKLGIQEAALAHVWKHGANVYTVDQGEVLRDDPDDPMRNAMRQMIGVFGELERGVIAARLRAGRQLKAERGGYAYGAPRFGTVAIDKELVQAPEEQATIDRIVELDRAGRSLRHITTTLNLEGRPPKRGEKWHPETVRRVLARVAVSATPVIEAA